eukprot:scaffold17914_cov31-Tisochrysis_lutea.AAC.4
MSYSRIVVVALTYLLLLLAWPLLADAVASSATAPWGTGGAGYLRGGGAKERRAKSRAGALHRNHGYK